MFRRLLNAIRYRARLLPTLPIRRRLGQQVRALDDAGFAFISNNCLAGQLYEMAGRPKSTPTAGLYFTGDSYARFLEDISDGHATSWDRIDPDQMTRHHQQHCAMLRTGEASGVVFLHYPEPEVAARKWNSRFPRLAGREKIVIASLRDGIAESMLDRAKTRYRHFYVAGPAPALPADEFVLDRKCLSGLSAFLDDVLAMGREAARR